MRILLTAFEPFGGRSLNPSAEVLTRVRPRAGLRTRLLPVELGRTWPGLQVALDEESPGLVLAMGEAGGRSEICLERCAYNELDFRVPDNAGAQPRGEPIEIGGPAKRESGLPLDSWIETLRDQGHAFRISEDAGRHLCNATLYGLLAEYAASFIHLPLIPEQLGDEEEGPSLPLEEQVQALEALLDLALGA